MGSVGGGDGKDGSGGRTLNREVMSPSSRDAMVSGLRWEMRAGGKEGRSVETGRGDTMVNPASCA